VRRRAYWLASLVILTIIIGIGAMYIHSARYAIENAKVICITLPNSKLSYYISVRNNPKVFSAFRRLGFYEGHVSILRSRPRCQITVYLGEPWSTSDQYVLQHGRQVRIYYYPRYQLVGRDDDWSGVSKDFYLWEKSKDPPPTDQQ
jgi:hypothetical protein